MELRTKTPGTVLEKLTWLEAEHVLNEDAVIVIPLGAAAKEHGPHLPLNNDWLIAQYFAAQLLTHTDIVLAPGINYSYYPAFVEFPGSVSLSLTTACNMICEICQSLARFGPRRFYVLNTGVSTTQPLSQASALLRQSGILLAFTDLHRAFKLLPDDLLQQEGGSHADEAETSLMLVIAADSVNMHLAARDFHADASGPLSRTRQPRTSYSPSGVWGDATLASREKGLKIVECLMACILDDVDKVRHARLP